LEKIRLKIKLKIKMKIKMKIKLKIKMKIKVPRIPVMIKVSGAIKPVSFDVRNSCHTGD
jgi:hypothetical protein